MLRERAACLQLPPLHVLEVVPPDGAALALVVEARAHVVGGQVRVGRAAAVGHEARVGAGRRDLGA